MTLFAFEALDSQGRTVRGRRETSSSAALAQALEREALTPLTIRPSRAPIQFARSWLNDAEAGRLAGDIARYLRSGLSVVQALALLAEASSPRVRGVVTHIRDRILAGEPLSAAFSEAGGPSGQLLQSLAAAGEVSGQQADILESGGSALMASAALKRRLATLSLYPAFVLAVALGAVGLYAFAVLPALEPAFAELTGELPMQTRLVIGLGGILRTALPLSALAVGVLALGLMGSARLRAVAREWVGRLLTSPLAAGVLTDMIFAGVAARMSISLRAGVPLLAAYRTAIAAITFTKVRKAVEAQEDRLREGIPLSEALSAAKVVPVDFVRLVQVGERSDDLARVLAEAAQLLTVRAQEKAERLLAVATPVIVVLIGVLVGMVTLMVFQGLLAVTGAVDV